MHGKGQMHRRKWYLSFASPGKFLGACVVEADGFIEAVDEANHLGINPGGEVLGWDVTDFPAPPFPMNELLTIEQLGRAKKLGEMSNEDARAVTRHAQMICDSCNE